MTRSAVLAALAMAVAIPFLPPGQAFAQDTQPAPLIEQPPPRATYTAARIQEMLDEPVGPRLGEPAKPVVLSDDLLIDVLRRLEGDHARWLDVPGATLSFLPYGERTKVSLRAPADTTIRKLLTLLLDSYALTYTIIESPDGRGVLRVVPTDELARIGRRATIDEMHLLNILRTTRIADWGMPLAEQLTKAAGRPISFKFDLAGIDPATAYRRFNATLTGMAPNTVAGLLDQFCHQLNCAWRVEGNSIVVADRIRQVMHQLQRRVSVRWSDLPLNEALTQIARTAGLLAQFQPGMMEGVEAGSRRVNLQAPDEAIIQIIETLSARTGIGYEVRENSIYFFGPRRMDPIIGMVTLPSRTGQFGYQMFLRRSMLSPKAQEALDVRLQEAADAMSKELTDPNQAREPLPRFTPPQ